MLTKFQGIPIEYWKGSQIGDYLKQGSFNSEIEELNQIK